MKILAPLLTGKENSVEYVTAITTKVDNIILLQVIDRDFMDETSKAMGEVMQFSSMMEDLRQQIGQKRKKCEEITEWGHTVKKVMGIALIQNVDKVVFVNQDNKFFKDMLKELKKNKIEFETINIHEEEKNK
jgi:ABC-type uncharacterized transport system fused permease/ATPase subunit